MDGGRNSVEELKDIPQRLSTSSPDRGSTGTGGSIGDNEAHVREGVRANWLCNYELLLSSINCTCMVSTCTTVFILTTASSARPCMTFLFCCGFCCETQLL